MLDPAPEPVSPSRQDKPHHFANAAARLDVLNRVCGSDAAVAKLLDVDRSQPRRWREGQLPDPAKVLFLDRISLGSLSYGVPEPLHLAADAVEEAARLLGVQLSR